MSHWGLIDNTLEGRQNLWFPHWSAHRVPTDPAENASYRKQLAVSTDRTDQRVIRRMCEEDFLFYLASFVYIFNAGDEEGEPGPVPFVPYDFQVELFTLLWDCLHGDRRPARVKKPRKMGLTWCVVSLLEHCWHFMPNRHILIGSRREDEVDGTMTMQKGAGFVGEWSKLMPKFDFIHLYQPQWLLPEGYRPRTEPYRTRMKLMNPGNGSIVWGTSAAATAGRQERGYAAFWDEAAHTDNLYEIIGSLSEFSPCKLWVSSIGNLDHAFSTTLRDSPNIAQAAPQWWMHPLYSVGLELDPKTGERTSPWLRRKLDEIGHDPVIANREYYADESRQIGGYYAPDTFRKMLGAPGEPGTVQEAFYRGEFDIIETTEGPIVSRWCDQPNGRWFLWFRFDAGGRPPRSTRYVIGVDVAAGTTDQAGRGASNSVIAVADWLTGSIVAELATHGVKPYEFAATACAVGRFFQGDDHGPAWIVYERNGPGAEFGETLLKRYRYPNLFSEDRTRSSETKWGWHKDGRGDNARLAFGLHQEMICDGRLKERSADCVAEMRHYQHNPNGHGAPIHSASILSDDPSGARDNHGDRVIARVCICQVMRKPYAALPKPGTAPWGSYRALKEAERRERYRDGLI